MITQAIVFIVFAFLSIFNDLNAVRPPSPKIMVSADLAQVAQQRADDLATQERFDHEGFLGESGQWLMDRGWLWVGENIWRGNFHPDWHDILTGWQNSSRHNALLMEPKVRSAGLGIAKGVDGFTRVVLILGYR